MFSDALNAELFTSNSEPVPLDLIQISELKRARDDAKCKETQLYQFQTDFDARTVKHLKTDDDLRTTTVELENIGSTIDKYEQTITKLTEQCRTHLKHQESLRQALAEQKETLRQHQTSLENRTTGAQ